jgi:catecholate siderophore receptor
VDHYRLGEGWEIGGGANYWSSWWLTDQNSGPNAAKAPGYTVFDATAAYVKRKYEIRLNLFNLTDELYYVGAYQNSPSRVVPGVPRSMQLSMRYSFD